MLPENVFKENGFDVLLCELLRTIPKYSLAIWIQTSNYESAIKCDYNEQVIKGFSCPVKM